MGIRRDATSAPDGGSAAARPAVGPGPVNRIPAVLRSWLEGLARGAFELNRRNLLELAAASAPGRFCDLGCDDGAWTLQVARAARAVEVAGIEIVSERAHQARTRGVQAVVADLNQELPFAGESFDLVHANQVIEHVSDVDRFMSEVTRVLRPGGTSLISTENGSSWHNVGAAAAGWQIFSLTNLSGRVGGIGNPFALHRGTTGHLQSWTHKTIFNYRGLLEFHEVHGLRPVRVLGAGYHPLPPALGRFDRRHAHVLAVMAIKD